MILMAVEYFKYDYYFCKNYPEEYKNQMRRSTQNMRSSYYNLFKDRIKGDMKKYLQFETDPSKTDELTQYKRRLNNLIKFGFVSFLVVGVGWIFLGF